MLAATGEISLAAGTMHGVKNDYCFEVPTKSWYLRDETVAHKDNPLSDRWVIRPDLDAHVMIVAEEVPGMTIDQKRYENALEKDARERLADFRMLGRDALTGGAALHYSGRIKNMNLECYRGAFTDGSRA